MPKFNLSEAAAEILAKSVASKRAGQDKPAKLSGDVAYGTKEVELGDDPIKSTDHNPDATKGAPTATPPGATPPVGSEPMKKLSRQPQETMGRSDLKSVEGDSTSHEAIRDRIAGKKPTQTMQPNKGAHFQSYSEETETDDNLIQEGKRLISTHKHEGGPHSAKVYRDPEWNEYQVHFYKDGKHMGEKAVHYTNDKEDATSTADVEIKRLNKSVQKEEVEELDEARGRKLISIHKHEGPHSAKVYRHPDDNEYQVHFYKNNEHMGEKHVYYTDDKADARNTADSGVKHLNKSVQKEEVEELDEARGGLLNRFIKDIMGQNPEKISREEKFQISGGEKFKKFKAQHMSEGFETDEPVGKKKETSSGGEEEKTKTGVKHKAGGGRYGTDKKAKEKMEEDVEALLSGENLSEEFKQKATTIFEAAVMTRVNEIAEEVESQLQEQFNSALEEVKEDFGQKIDSYLNYMVEEWMKQNELAIESGLRSEIVEEFIGGLRNLFAEHYIDIPTEKVNVVEELASKVQELEEKLNEEVTRSVELKNEINEHKKNEAIHTVCEGLAQTQVEKIKALAENVEFTTEEEFAAKLVDIKESYFPNQSIPAEKSALEEGIDIEEEKTTVKSGDPLVDMVAKTISKSVLK